MGNLLTQSFEEIWGGAAYQKLRAEHGEFHLRENCQHCPAAGLGNVNNREAFLVRKPTGPAFLAS